MTHDEEKVRADEIVGSTVGGEGLGVDQSGGPATVGPDLIRLGSVAFRSAIDRLFARHTVGRDDEVLARFACHHSHEKAVSAKWLLRSVVGVSVLYRRGRVKWREFARRQAYLVQPCRIFGREYLGAGEGSSECGSRVTEWWSKGGSRFSYWL